MAAESEAEPQIVPPEAGDGGNALNGRELLGIEPLRLRDLPHHKEFTGTSEQTVAIASFLKRLLAEAQSIDIDNGWTSYGTWQPQGDRVKISMPASSSNPDASTVHVTTTVEQRAKGEGRKVWIARRSRHHVREIDFEELDEILARDHAKKEAEYTPSVYDANELLKWDAEELGRVVGELEEWRATNVEMSLYQMFHAMPSALGGLAKLQDRVFHVLVVTIHSTYPVETDGSTNLHPQATTFQLSVDIHSLNSVESVMKRSHTDANFKRYRFLDNHCTSGQSPNVVQRDHNGNSLIEGSYVSMERLRKAPHVASTDLQDPAAMHQWDMMTMSDAKGITRLASQKTIVKGTLDAVTKDVYYVLDHIKHLRESAQNGGTANEPSPNAPARRMSVQDKVKKILGQKEGDEIQLTKVP